MMTSRSHGPTMNMHGSNPCVPRATGESEEHDIKLSSERLSDFSDLSYRLKISRRFMRISLMLSLTMLFSIQMATADGTSAVQSNTVLVLDGTDWMNWTLTQKIAFIEGFLAGSAAHAYALKYDFHDRYAMNDLISTASVGELIVEVSLWYTLTGDYNAPLYLVIYARGRIHG